MHGADAASYMGDVGDPLDLAGDEVRLVDIVADGQRTVVGQQARPRPRLGIERRHGRDGEIFRARRCVRGGHQDPLAARTDVLVAHPLEVEPCHREPRRIGRMGVDDGADIGPGAHECKMQVQFAGRCPRPRPGAGPQVDEWMISSVQSVVCDTPGRYDEAVLVNPHTHVAGRSHDHRVSDHVRAGRLHGLASEVDDRLAGVAGGGRFVHSFGLYCSLVMRTIDWHDDHIVAIDQTLLPHTMTMVELRTVDEVIDAVQRLVIRGAPALGVAGALGTAIAALDAQRRGLGADHVIREAARVASARPTAVNLAWGVQRCLDAIDGGAEAMVCAAIALVQEDIDTNRELSRRGAELVRSLADGPLGIHTHCNAGGLACVEWGTALGIVRALHEAGGVREVFVDETRPLLQGARLTAFELTAMGIAHRVVVDGAGASVIGRGMVDVVIVGADRVAANGDVVNKIGTYPLALAAHRAGVPFVVAAPESTIDRATPDGLAVHIELRDPSEVVSMSPPGQTATGAPTTITPAGTGAWNPAFDVTPWDLVTALVTEARVVRLAAGQSI